jgi:zinc transport system permease protein
MTLPVAASIRIANGFKQTIGFSVLFGEISVLVGLVSAFYLDLAPGGTIVVTAILILLFTILFKKISSSRKVQRSEVEER